MTQVLNNVRIYEIQPVASPSRPSFRENVYLSWGINALIRYWHSKRPAEFSYNKGKDKPLTEEERREWGI